MAQTLESIDARIKGQGRAGYIVAVNPEKVFAARRNPFLKEFLGSAFLLIPDGIGLVMALRFFGHRASRVPGSDLMLNICTRAPHCGYRIFIYGAREEVNKGAVDRLREMHPGIQIVGRANGYVQPQDMGSLIEEINASAADILFVALGSPKQEVWIQQNLGRLNVKICQGIGGTLDTIVGRVKRAPLFFQNLGLEWFYRLISEPKRIKRQLVLPRFALEVLRERTLNK